MGNVAPIWTSGEKARAEACWQAYTHPHRRMLVDAVKTLAPFDGLIEVGCNSGPNLRLLREAFPDAALAGCDSSEVAMAYGDQQFDALGLTPPDFYHITLPDGFDEITMSADIVLSCYTLAYVHPDQIGHVLAHLTRIARRAILIAEPMVAVGAMTGQSGLIANLPEWRHDYLSWFRDVAGWQCGIPKACHAGRMNAYLMARRP